MVATILLIDDHPAFRMGFACLLEPMPGGVVLHEAGSVRQALARLEAGLACDLVAYDWNLPDGGGLNGLLALLQIAPFTPVVVVSGSEEAAVRLTALQVGARAFIPKSAEPAAMREALMQALRGPGGRIASQAGEPGTLPAARDPARHLTVRQREVLQLLADGHPNKEIATLLGIADATARDHVSDVLNALGARNRTEAVSIAAKQRLLGGAAPGP